MAILKFRDAEGNVQEILAIKGEDYVLTNADKLEIAGMVASMVVLPTDASSLTEEQVIALIQANMPANGDEVSY